MSSLSLDIRRQAKELLEVFKPGGEVGASKTKLPLRGRLQLCSEIA